MDNTTEVKKLSYEQKVEKAELDTHSFNWAMGGVRDGLPKDAINKVVRLSNGGYGNRTEQDLRGAVNLDGKLIILKHITATGVMGVGGKETIDGQELSTGDSLQLTFLDKDGNEKKLTCKRVFNDTIEGRMAGNYALSLETTGATGKVEFNSIVINSTLDKTVKAPDSTEATHARQDMALSLFKIAMDPKYKIK